MCFRPGGQIMIPASAVTAFLDSLADGQVNLHGFILLRGGKPEYEGYWKPYAKQQPHRMFSVSKSLTSLAIGILTGEQKLRLDDRIAFYFPEYLPDPVPDAIAAMTIRNMLTMSTAHRFTTYKQTQDDNWTRTFFTSPPTNMPGTVFAYDTSSSHTLAALVQKLTGETLLAFLQQRLLKPLGCTGATEWLTDPAGVCQGGTGLMMTLPDLARVATLCMRGGDGLVPKSYLEEATKAQIPTVMQPLTEEQHGYGYQFWQTRGNGYAMYGIGGQLAFCLPDQDLCVCTVGDTLRDPLGIQKIYNAVFQQLLPRLSEPDDARARLALQTRLDSLTLPTIKNHPEYAEQRDAVYTFPENPMSIKKLQLQSGCICFTDSSGAYSLPFGTGTLQEGVFPCSDLPCYTSAGWITPHLFQLMSHVLGREPGVMNLLLSFTEHGLTVQASSASTAYTQRFNGVVSSR